MRTKFKYVIAAAASLGLMAATSATPALSLPVSQCLQYSIYYCNDQGFTPGTQEFTSCQQAYIGACTIYPDDCELQYPNPAERWRCVFG